MEDRPIAFITGSGRRLGRKIAWALAEAGFDIILHAYQSLEGLREASVDIANLGRNVLQFRANLASVKEIHAMTTQLSAKIERLDVLVNNAGVFPEASFEDVTVDMWDEAMNVNTRSVFFLTQACAPLLRRSKGCVVNLASAGGFEPWKKHIPYNVSKAGVIMLTRALAKSLAPDVRVNAIAPGIIVVPGEETRLHLPEERIPLKRYGSPADIAAAVLYLVRDASYLTGHILPVDGGSHSIG